MNAPKCKLCRERHWPRQGCVSKKSSVTTSTPSDKPVYVELPPDDGSVRTGVNLPPVPGEPCPTCGRVVAKYKDNAERQAAYRKRKGEA